MIIKTVACTTNMWWLSYDDCR